MADPKKNYGANQMSGASSDTPGQRTRAALSVNNDDTDKALASVREKGAGPSNPLTHEQLRTVAGSKPPTYGMKVSTPTDSPKVPGVLDTHCDTYAKPKP